MKRTTVVLTAVFMAWMAPMAQAQTPPRPVPQSRDLKPPEANRPRDWAPRRYIEYWNKETFDPKEAISKVFGVPIIMHSHGGTSPVDMGMLSRFIAVWHTSMPDVHFDIQDSFLSADGNKVAMRVLLRGTAEKPLIGPLGPGPHYVVATQMFIFRLQEDGRIREIWEEQDETRMRLQMGEHFAISPVPANTTNPPATEQPKAKQPGTAQPGTIQKPTDSPADTDIMGDAPSKPQGNPPQPPSTSL